MLLHLPTLQIFSRSFRNESLTDLGEKVSRTRHAIVRSREKRQIVKVKDYINDFNGQKYQAEEVSRTDRI